MINGIRKVAKHWYRYLTLCEIQSNCCLNLHLLSISHLTLLQQVVDDDDDDDVTMSCLGVGLDNGYDDGAGQEPARTVPLFHLATTVGRLVGFFVIDHYVLVLIVCDERENLIITTIGIIETSL